MSALTPVIPTNTSLALMDLTPNEKCLAAASIVDLALSFAIATGPMAEVAHMVSQLARQTFIARLPTIPRLLRWTVHPLTLAGAYLLSKAAGCADLSWSAPISALSAVLLTYHAGLRIQNPMTLFRRPFSSAVLLGLAGHGLGLAAQTVVPLAHQIIAKVSGLWAIPPEPFHMTHSSEESKAWIATTEEDIPYLASEIEITKECIAHYHYDHDTKLYHSIYTWEHPMPLEKYQQLEAICKKWDRRKLPNPRGCISNRIGHFEPNNPEHPEEGFHTIDGPKEFMNCQYDPDDMQKDYNEFMAVYPLEKNVHRIYIDFYDRIEKEARDNPERFAMDQFDVWRRSISGLQPNLRKFVLGEAAYKAYDEYVGNVNSIRPRFRPPKVLGAFGRDDSQPSPPPLPKGPTVQESHLSDEKIKAWADRLYDRWWHPLFERWSALQKQLEKEAIPHRDEFEMWRWSGVRRDVSDLEGESHTTSYSAEELNGGLPTIETMRTWFNKDYERWTQFQLRKNETLEKQKSIIPQKIQEPCSSNSCTNAEFWNNEVPTVDQLHKDWNWNHDRCLVEESEKESWRAFKELTEKESVSPKKIKCCEDTCSLHPRTTYYDDDEWRSYQTAEQQQTNRPALLARIFAKWKEELAKCNLC